MKPFYGEMQHGMVDLNDSSKLKNGIFYNGYRLIIDPIIYPTTPFSMEKIYAAMFRFTSFLNTLQLNAPNGRVIKITGFNDYNTFRMEIHSPMYYNNLPFNCIYKEENGKPSIITKWQSIKHYIILLIGKGEKHGNRTFRL